MVEPDAVAFLIEFLGGDLCCFNHVARTYETDVTTCVRDRDAFTEFECVIGSDLVVLYLAANDANVEGAGRFRRNAQDLPHFFIAAGLDDAEIRNAKEQAELFVALMRRPGFAREKPYLRTEHFHVALAVGHGDIELIHEPAAKSIKSAGEGDKSLLA